MTSKIPTTKRIDGNIWELEFNSKDEDTVRRKANKVRCQFKNARVMKTTGEQWVCYSRPSLEKMVSRGKYL